MYKRDILSKLKSRVGETITETLVSVLIAALGLTMLAGMVNSASKMVLSNKDVMLKYYDGNNILDHYMSIKDVDLNLAENISASDISSGNYTLSLVAGSTDALESKTYSVSGVENKVLSKNRIIAYLK